MVNLGIDALVDSWLVSYVLYLQAFKSINLRSLPCQSQEELLLFAILTCSIGVNASWHLRYPGVVIICCLWRKKIKIKLTNFVFGSLCSFSDAGGDGRGLPAKVLVLSHPLMLLQVKAARVSYITLRKDSNESVCVIKLYSSGREGRVR